MRGDLVIWWNVFRDPLRPTDFKAAMSDLYRRLMPTECAPLDDLPGPMRVESWTETLTEGGWFEVRQVELVRWEHLLTTDGARRLYASFPNVNELDTTREPNS